jgi:hypothetical protein
MIRHTREYYQAQLNDMRPYILNAMYLRGRTKCAICNKVLMRGTKCSFFIDTGLRIDHTRYGDDITIDDLRLMCYDCHLDHTVSANDSRLSGSYCPYCQRPY